MKTASVKEIKDELTILSHPDLLQLCLRLVKFKKENKELINYLVFESANEEHYVKSAQAEISEMFKEVNTKNIYFAKKTIRKISRTAQRYIKYSNIETTEADILLFVCLEIKKLNLPLHKSPALENLYAGLLKKIRKSVASMHEDLQFEYVRELKKLDS
jgi:hypothetical protein